MCALRIFPGHGHKDRAGNVVTPSRIRWDALDAPNLQIPAIIRREVAVRRGTVVLGGKVVDAEVAHQRVSALILGEPVPTSE